MPFLHILILLYFEFKESVIVEQIKGVHICIDWRV